MVNEESEECEIDGTMLDHRVQYAANNAEQKAIYMPLSINELTGLGEGDSEPNSE